jgi:hypothetical protein
MNSLQFFKHSSVPQRPAVDWGTGKPQEEKFNQGLIYAPTYLLNNQPTTQYYRENNLELSNLRDNDQL